MKHLGSILIILFIFIILIISIIYLFNAHIDEKMAKTDDILLKVIERIRGLHPVINSITFQRATKSYTINKSKVHICIYDENGDSYPINMLTYVMIHEISHVITKSIGHTDEFYENFDNLLDIAISKGMYDPSIPLVQNYCGHK